MGLGNENLVNKTSGIHRYPAHMYILSHYAMLTLTISFKTANPSHSYLIHQVYQHHPFHPWVPEDQSDQWGHLAHLSLKVQWGQSPLFLQRCLVVQLLQLLLVFLVGLLGLWGLKVQLVQYILIKEKEILKVSS